MHLYCKFKGHEECCESVGITQELYQRGIELKNYTEETLLEFRKASVNVLNLEDNYFYKYKAELPKLSISDKVFHPSVAPYIMTVKRNIDSYCGNQDVKELLKLGWLTTLELASLYKKAGTGLKKNF